MYALFSNGKLLPGADEENALRAVLQIYQITEEQARGAFLSGRRRKLRSSNDDAKLRALCDRLRASGLDVEVVSIAVSARKAKVRHSVVAASLLLLLMGGAAGFAWQWLYGIPPPSLLRAETAMADGRLLAIGHIDVGKIVLLSDLVLGGADPAALPGSGEKKQLLGRLFSGPADWKNNLQMAMFSIHMQPEEKTASTSLLLAGNFLADTVLAELERAFDVTQIEKEQWTLIEKAASTSSLAASCEKEPGRTAVSAGAGSYFLVISPHWLLISTTQRGAMERWHRLESGAPARQDISRWQTYRTGQVAAVLVEGLDRVAAAMTGLPRIVVADAAKKSPDVKAAGIAAAVDIPSRGLKLNATLFSASEAWNRSTSDKAREKLASWQADGGALSPALAQLVSRVVWNQSNEHVGFDVALDQNVLREIEQVAGDVLSSMFVPKLAANEASPKQEELQPQPADYEIYAGLSALPEYLPPPGWAQPLYKHGAYAAEFDSASVRKDGLPELAVKGSVQMPKGRKFGESGGELLSMTVASVQGHDGRALLRDEHCVSPKEMLFRKNHEPETSFSISNEQATLVKKVRLDSGVRFSDIAQITGTIKFTAPMAVRKFSIEPRAGEVIEHQGLRVYVTGVRNGSITYQVSGDFRRLLEVRALNKNGQALRGDWSVNSSGEGRIVRNFRGEVRGIDVFVAERWHEEEQTFVLRDLIRPPVEPSASRSNKFAPERIDPLLWQQYAKFDFSAIAMDKSDWQFHFGKDGSVTERNWSTMKAYIGSSPVSWTQDVQALLYFPALKELPGVMSALSYRVDVPRADAIPREVFVPISFPYSIIEGPSVAVQRLTALPVARQSVWLATGTPENERTSRLIGEFIVRLPVRTTSIQYPLNDLWPGKETNGITVTLTDIGRGIFPGYALKAEGSIEKLINVHGVTRDGQRVLASPVNLQRDGYWTMTLPFTDGLEMVEIITAAEQSIMRFPFDMAPKPDGTN